MICKFTLAGAAIASLALAVLPAAAATQVWDLTNVKFDDGSTASGSFTTLISPDGPPGAFQTGVVTGYNIKVTAGALTSFDYNTGTSFESEGDANLGSVTFLSNDFSRYLFLDFQTSLIGLTSAPLVLGYGGLGSLECDNCSTLREIVSGSVVDSVPEVPAWALMIIGFGGLGAALRLRRRATNSSPTTWIAGA